MASLYETAARLHDTRVKGRSKHLLADIVILAVLAVTSGAESYEAIEEFGRFHYQTLKKRLRLPNGIPSHDTINRVFQAIRFRQFERLFLEWAEGLRPEGATEKVIAIDGKTVRGSRDGYHDNPAIHLVHAWSVENGICLGQRKTRDKSNEITAIPELLDMLCVEGSIITIDAMGTQTAIAEKIVDGGADYILALKGNQGTLLQDAELMEREAAPVSESEEVDKGHGRVETRSCKVYEPTEWIRQNHEWKGLQSIVKITAVRWNAVSKEETVETRWYISSLGSKADFIRYIRGHWGVENSLHWVLDMSFGEDRQRKRAGMAAENFALVRKFSLNILRRDKGKGSLVTKRLKAGWSIDYLFSLFSFGNLMRLPWVSSCFFSFRFSTT